MPHHFLGEYPVWTTPMGNGPNPALLLHCALAHSGAWKGMMAKLNTDLRALAFDLPSHGQSGDWDGSGDYHDLARDVALDLLGDRPADLVGHSLGATVALRLAVERPDLVRSLTLIEPVYFVAAKGTAAFKSYKASLRHFAGPLMAGDKVAAARYFTGQWGDGRGWEQQSDDERAYAVNRIGVIPATEAQVMRDAAGVLAPGALEALTMPVLLMRGAESPTIMTAVQEALAARIPHAETAVIDEARHMLPITHPVPCAAAIQAFLARIG
jgi:lipase